MHVYVFKYVNMQPCQGQMSTSNVIFYCFPFFTLFKQAAYPSG